MLDGCVVFDFDVIKDSVGELIVVGFVIYMKYV